MQAGADLKPYLPETTVWTTFPARCVIFDLDDTLAPSKTKIDATMAEALGRLLERAEVCIISGGRFEQFSMQVLDQLGVDHSSLHRLHLMPTCGTRYYRYSDGAWTQLYSEDLSSQEKLRVIDALQEGAQVLELQEENPWGDVIEDRGSQITFSALGQAAPVDAKHAWDPDGQKKARLAEYVSLRVPDLEVRSGGSTSIDVTRKGIDKAYGVHKLMDAIGVEQDDLLFIGDRLDVGGNDFPVRAMGVTSVRVENPEQTLRLINHLLSLPDA